MAQPMKDARMNSTGFIMADGHSRVQNGDTIVHNYPDSSRYLAGLAATQRAELRTDFLRHLYTSRYEERKDRNPERASGTCEWFIAHKLFRHWQDEASALLWVSADPGCGKSVLAKYLVDDILASSASRTTCYFFFKDDFDDQKVLEGAFCCILRQLFLQKPDLLLDGFLDDFREERDQFTASFKHLWNCLLEAASRHDGEIVCILDALDECVNLGPLAVALTRLYNTSKGVARLKFLVTSRPYRTIQRDFRSLEQSQPTIHLSGENQEEVDKIAEEITISIRQRIEELGEKIHLAKEEKESLHHEIASVNNRTYLWIHLVFAVIEEAVILNRSELRTIIHEMPRTVEEAYDKILHKSRDPQKARNVLHIIVAADRPLSLHEMAVVLALQGEQYQHHRDLEKDLLSANTLHTAVRDACGLFVVVKDSQVFLLHQTAKEFLVQMPPELSKVCSPSLEWQHTLHPQVSHRLLSEACMRYLLLKDFEIILGMETFGELKDERKFVFLDYAASNWADHYRQAHSTPDPEQLEPLAERLCQTHNPKYLHWLEFYGRRRLGYFDFCRELSTPTSIASYFGLDDLVRRFLLKDKKNIAAVGVHFQRTALSWASEKGHASVVKVLLDRLPTYRVILGNLPGISTVVNRPDRYGKTPLWYAAVNGHRAIVSLLLDKGAKVDIRDENGLTPLLWAAHHGHSDIVSLLLDKGAQQDIVGNFLTTRDRYGRTPLLKAVYNGDEPVARLLLQKGADTEDTDEFEATALIRASGLGHETIVELLLQKGANIEASDEDGRTALIYAAKCGHEATVGLLLQKGANIEASDSGRRTALIYAVEVGHETMVELLLQKGANIEALNSGRGKALMHAAKYGHGAIMELLLQKGVNIEASNLGGKTALIYAAEYGREAAVGLLLQKGANTEASDEDGRTALMHAARCGHKAIVALLLDRGARKDVQDKDGFTAVRYASYSGEREILKILKASEYSLERRMFRRRVPQLRRPLLGP